MTISEYKCPVPIFCICRYAPLIKICNAFFFLIFCVKETKFKMKKKKKKKRHITITYHD